MHHVNLLSCSESESRSSKDLLDNHQPKSAPMSLIVLRYSHPFLWAKILTLCTLRICAPTFYHCRPQLQTNYSKHLSTVTFKRVKPSGFLPLSESVLGSGCFRKHVIEMKKSCVTSHFEAEVPSKKKIVKQQATTVNVNNLP